jgi:hypothetical protein
MGKLLGRIVVGLTSSLIAFIAYSSQLFIIWPWYGRELSVDLLLLLVPFKSVLVVRVTWVTVERARSVFWLGLFGCTIGSA